MEDCIKIGLFGGSFDPIHNGHLQLASWTKDKLSLNRIIFIPAEIPPHKQHVPMTDSEHRYRMVQMAIENYPDFEISDVELKRKGISYTIDTIYYYQKLFTLCKDNLFLIIGADSLVEFSSWRYPDKILNNCQVVVLQRPEINLDKALTEFKRQVMILQSPLIEISSTKIRQRVKIGKSISDFVPPPVERYIYELNLYR